MNKGFNQSFLNPLPGLPPEGKVRLKK